jgi:hypothetical protein
MMMLLTATRLLASETPIEVNPNRPSFATPAHTTQQGVVDLELGLQRNLPRDGGGVSSSPFLLKLGLLSNLELRLGGNGLLRQGVPGSMATTGFGDTTLGAQWCNPRKALLGLDLAAQVAAKLPTASSDKGLGSGEADVLLMLVVSRDLGRCHVDANAIVTWLGRPEAAGADRERQPAGTVCVNRALGERWSVTGELYTIGATSQNPRIVSNLWAAGCKMSRRLVLDAGVDVGLSHGAQKISFFAGSPSGGRRAATAYAPRRLSISKQQRLWWYGHSHGPILGFVWSGAPLGSRRLNQSPFLRSTSLASM